MTTPIEFGTTSQKNSSSQTKKQQQSHVTTTTNKSISGSSSTSLSDWSGGAGVLPGRAAVGPLFLMAITPVFVMVVCHVFTQHRGNAMAFSSHVHSQYAAQWAEINNNYASTTTTENSKLSLHYEAMVRLTKAIVWEQIWPSAGDWFTWHMIASFLIFQLALMRLVPGKAFVATVTPTGHRPVYKANGMASFLITLCVLMALDYTDTFRMSLVYDNFGTILSSMNVLAWIVCALLVVKGTIAPSGRDSGCTGSYITNFYWGMELYPRVLGWDVKQFTNCRAGMMFWAVAIVSFCYKNMELNGGHLQYGLAVSVALQLIYIAKFFHWEMGYMCSMDIQHDRAGYYICWGCLVWVPAIYTSAAFYLVESGPKLSATTAVGIFLAGWLCIWINFDSDRQRYIFRQSNGQCLIWGHAPRFIVASYQTSSKETETKTSLLLVDGWWKISRHFHYVPEILASLCWSLPALDSGFIGPYFYVIYLTVLLTDRAFRDDNRCRAKYGKDWDEYCTAVPYKILPGIV